MVDQPPGSALRQPEDGEPLAPPSGTGMPAAQPGTGVAPSAPPPSVPTKFCFACGAVLDARAEICPKCGVRQQPPPVQSVDAALGRSRIVAALLGIILGGFGIHKFYLGKIVQGVIYLIFFWTFVPAIVGFIEGIWYLIMSDAEFQQRYPR